MSSPSVSSATPTASQVTTVLDSVSTALKGKDLNAILTALPSVLVEVYQTVVQFIDAPTAAQQTVVISLLQQALSLLSLPAGDLAILTTVLNTLVPEVLSLLPQIEQGLVVGFTAVEKAVESECTTCWSKLKACFSSA